MFVDIKLPTELAHTGRDNKPVYEKDIAIKEDKHLTKVLEPVKFEVIFEQRYNPFEKELEKVSD